MNQDTLNTQFVRKLYLGKISSLNMTKGEGKKRDYKDFFFKDK